MLRAYGLSGKVIGLQVEREAEASEGGFADATIWFHGHVNLTLCARGANRAQLDEMLQQHFVPNLR